MPVAMKTDILSAAAYYAGSGGYYEKASGAAQYLTRDVANFAKNKGSKNYTYFGKFCGFNPGAWCAMAMSVLVYEACGNSTTAAKEAMWGVWPYTACNQLFDAGLKHGASHYSYYQRVKKGRGGADYTPRPRDIIVFTDDTSTRTHTGIVYSVANGTVYTYEGNSGDMFRKRSYALTSSYIYGYVTLNLDTGSGTATVTGDVAKFQEWIGTTPDNEYGPNTKKAAIKKHQTYLNSRYKAGLVVDGEWGPETYYATEPVQKPDDTDDARVWQGLLYCLGYDPKGFDGSFGDNTEAATEKLQAALGLNPIGIADRYTWARALGYSRPEHKLLRRGSKGSEVRYLQRKLTDHGYPLETDGSYGPATEAAVRSYQTAEGLEVDGVAGPETWGSID